MSKGTVFFVRNGRLVEAGVPSIHDPEYQSILKDKKALCDDLQKSNIQVNDDDIDDDSSIIYAMITAFKSLLHNIESDDGLDVEQENLIEKISKSLGEIETVCLECYSNYGAQLILKEKFLKKIDDIKKDIATITKKHMI